VHRVSRHFVAPLVLLVSGSLVVAACSSSSGHAKPAKSSSAASTSTPATSPSGSSTDVPVVEKTGITVTGAFGVAPKVTIPNKAAPKDLTEQTLIQGSGATVVAGDTLVANYVGETWATKPNVFDSSFSRNEPAGFVIGESQVIPGWDKTLVGKKLGSRILMTIPPADGYGASGNSQAGITGTDTLVFVVDLITTYKPTASAPGVVDSDMPAAGWPKITNVAGKEPTITSVAGIKAPTAAESKLLVRGTGAKIDSTKQLVVQLVETDIATGKQTQATWGTAPQVDEASDILQVVSALSGQSIGARAVALLPAEPAVAATATAAAQAASPAAVLIIDVVGQF